MELFEYYNNRIEKITKLLNEYGIKDLDEAKDICKSYNIFPEVSVKEVQNIAFDDAVYAYIVGCAIALKSGVKSASEAAILIGKG